MKKFLIKTAIYLVLITTILSFILIRYGGYVDYFYVKFTTPKQTSLIVGDSRSFQGIQPSIIDNYFKKGTYKLPMFNYSFTIAQAAYGELYTKSIKKKLNLETKNGLFILSVDPWLMAQREKDDFEKKIFTESSNPPYNMNFVSMNPNFEYFFKNFHYFHFKSIIRKSSELHKDGWLEESNLPKDTITLNQWKKIQIKMYSDFARRWKKCTYRLNQFDELVSFLKLHGKVVIVRMPIDDGILKIENNFWGNFNDEIEKIAYKNKIQYLDFSKNSNYRTYDGNHIDKYGGVFFTKDLCNSIKNTHN